MNCTHCEELISDYLENALDVRESNAVEAHLSQCAACTELLSGVREVIAWGKTFPSHEPSPWLATRIVASTPKVVHEGWVGALAGVGRWLIDARTAMAVFTATVMLSWLASVAGVDIRVGEIVRDPRTIYYRAEGFLNRAYGDAVHRYYRIPLVTEIQFQLERLRETS